MAKCPRLWIIGKWSGSARNHTVKRLPQFRDFITAGNLELRYLHVPQTYLVGYFGPPFHGADDEQEEHGIRDEKDYSKSPPFLA